MRACPIFTLILIVLFSAASQISASGTNAAGLGSAVYLPVGQPSVFVPSQSTTYSITAVNTGATTWHAFGPEAVQLGVHFVSGSTLLTDQRFSLPADVASGQAVTLSVTVAAPATPGPMTLETRLVEGVSWFAQAHDSKVSIRDGVDCGTTTVRQTCMDEMLSLINAIRTRASLTPYTLNMAQSHGTMECGGSYGHSVHMSRIGSISHDQFPSDICVPTATAGENVGVSWGGNEVQNLQTINGMMMSEPHNHATCATTVNHACNILSPIYHQVGIGIYFTGTETWVTEDFTT